MAYIHIAGRLGGDPETRVTAGGKKVTTFNVAENIRGSKGEEIVVWYRIVIWGDRFDKMTQYLKKGSAVFVIGEHRPTQWTDAQGQQRTTEEVWAIEVRFGPLPPVKQDKSDAPGHEHENHAPAPQRQPAFNAAPPAGGFAPQSPMMGGGSAVGQGHFDDPLHDEDLPF